MLQATFGHGIRISKSKRFGRFKRIPLRKSKAVNICGTLRFMFIKIFNTLLC